MGIKNIEDSIMVSKSYSWLAKTGMYVFHNNPLVSNGMDTGFWCACILAYYSYFSYFSCVIYSLRVNSNVFHFTVSQGNLFDYTNRLASKETSYSAPAGARGAGIVSPPPR